MYKLNVSPLTWPLNTHGMQKIWSVTLLLCNSWAVYLWPLVFVNVYLCVGKDVLTVSNEITKTNLHCQNVKWTTFIESCCFLSCYLQILAGQCEFFASAWSQHCLQRQWSTSDIQPEVAVQKMYTSHLTNRHSYTQICIQPHICLLECKYSKSIQN